MNNTWAREWLPSFVVPFVSLSYPTVTPSEPDSFPNSTYYNDGLLDACFVVTCIAVFALLRDITRLWFAEPFARWHLTRQLRKSKTRKNSVNGKGGLETPPKGEKTPLLPPNITKAEERILQRNVQRFAEQSWSVVYYTVQWGFGLYVNHNLPTSIFDMKYLWLNYPHTPLAGPVKFYYLTQTAFYTHQILILNAEARRKDHWQMMLHHVITVPLMVVSYSYYWTRVGCLIMVLMDWCDIWLPAAKMLKYLSFSTLCDAAFTFFMLSWLVTRHIIFVMVINSAIYDSKAILPYGWDPARGYYFTRGVYIACVGMLVALQLIQIVWFWMICRVAYKVISGQGAEDTRSDDEMDTEEEAEKKEQ